LVAWLHVDNLDDGGGSAITIERAAGSPAAVFDGIVFGENHPRQWTAGSNYFTRTDTLERPRFMEWSDARKLIKIAIVYRFDNSISVYRDNQLYDQYTKGYLETYTGAADSRVVFGLRHSDAGGENKFFTGRIVEARLYAEALSAQQLRALDTAN
jgi:hypothetical protein